MKKLNDFFFLLDEGEKLHLSDAIWFYGTLTLIVSIGFIAVL